MTDARLQTLETIGKLVSEGKLDRRKLFQTAAALGLTGAIGGTALATTASFTCYGQGAYYLRTVSTSGCGISYKMKYAITGAVYGNDLEPNNDFSQAALNPLLAPNTFAEGHVPDVGEAVSAGFLFDVPVRFDTDYLEVDLSAFAAGAIPKIPLIEIRV